MAELVRPFAALRPTAASAAEVVAPPYDVVSTDEARALAAGRPRSFLHISRPEIDLPEGSSPYSDDAYAQGARSLERLVAERVLVRDDQPSFYIYRMVMNGRTQTGVAFVGFRARLRAEPHSPPRADAARQGERSRAQHRDAERADGARAARVSRERRAARAARPSPATRRRCSR